jgi:integrative and conjugative element protein (TIGR02256 family)
MSFIWRKKGLAQRIRITDAVLNHVAKYQQHGPTSTEAGGQLFGTVSPTQVRVVVAAGPYPRDERGRMHHQSDQKSAQKVIRDQAKKGLLFLGEWHTHPEDAPTPSGADEHAIAAMVDKSILNTDAPILLIVGRLNPPAGLYLGTYQDGEIEDWHCGCIKEQRRDRVRRWLSHILRRY